MPLKSTERAQAVSGVRLRVVDTTPAMRLGYAVRVVAVAFLVFAGALSLASSPTIYRQVPPAAFARSAARSASPG